MRYLALTALALTAGCATVSAPNTSDARMTGTFDYVCDGQPVQVNFDNDNATATLSMGGNQTRMARQPSRAGFVYSSNGTSINGNQQRMQILSPSGTINCTMN